MIRKGGKESQIVVLIAVLERKFDEILMTRNYYNRISKIWSFSLLLILILFSYSTFSSAKLSVEAGEMKVFNILYHMWKIKRESPC